MREELIFVVIFPPILSLFKGESRWILGGMEWGGGVPLLIDPQITQIFTDYCDWSPSTIFWPVPVFPGELPQLNTLRCPYREFHGAPISGIFATLRQAV